MNEKAFRVLEYDKIIDMLKAQACSSMAKKMAGELLPSVSVREIREMQAETTEATTAIIRKGALPLGAFYDIEDSLYLAKKGGVLTMKQLLEVLYNLQVARGVVNFLKTDLPRLPIIMSMGEVLSIQKRLEENIDRCILSEDEMSDNASSELKSIRRAIVRQNEALRARMNQMLNSAENKTYLQDAIVTMRDGRYVIPVKQEHRARFPGIVHDQSSSGATLFIEPQAIVNLNNELRELEVAEKAEIERILAELSGNVGEHCQELLNNQKLLIKLDFIFAKGKLSVKQDAAEPTFSENGMMRIKKGRHPLIDTKKVVPISVELGGDYDTLIITGPNTGGKTVTLKTVGLLAMMAQAGLHIPASSGTEMGVFKKIYADIGDEQSIEQSLSTFSSHMRNIVEIVENADEETLVLLDELGAGTDPTEGAALAISILEELASRGTSSLATTHYTELKKYALSTPGVENASMEFNVDTLSPTYKLLVGVPGKSNAFEIAKKLGLEGNIIEKARTLLDKGDIEFEEVISAIESDRRAAEAERDEAVSLGVEIKKQKEEIEKRQAKLEAQREKILADARAEAKAMVDEAGRVAKEVQEELKELAKLESLGERNKRLDKNKRRLKDAAGRYKEVMHIEENKNPAKAEQLKVGSRVKVVSLGQNGHVLTLPDDKGDLFVQLALAKVNVNIKDLTIIIDGTEKKKKPRQKSSSYGNLYKQKAQNVSVSINVQGQNLDEATAEVDKYLDDAYIAGLEQVTVIHGRGEGILRQGLQKMFKSHKHVKSFRKGSFGEGGDGVTVVTLKKE